MELYFTSSSCLYSTEGDSCTFLYLLMSHTLQRPKSDYRLFHVAVYEIFRTPSYVRCVRKPSYRMVTVVFSWPGAAFCMHLSCLDWNTGYCDRHLRCFSQSLEADEEMLPYIVPLLPFYIPSLIYALISVT